MTEPDPVEAAKPSAAPGMARRHGFSRRSLSATMTALCVLSLVACSDRYPTEDVPQIDPARMTPAQLLAALNAIGEEPHLGKRWRYALHANCELEVSVRIGDTDRRRVVLEGAVVEARSMNGLTEVLLVPEVGGDTQAVTVLATRRPLFLPRGTPNGAPAALESVFEGG